MVGRLRARSGRGYDVGEGKDSSVNSRVQGFISMVVGAVVALLAMFGLVTSQSASPEPTGTDVITYGS